MTRRFYVDPGAIASPTAIITGSDVNHIRNVLRLGEGSRIRVFDGSGAEYEAGIMEVFKDRIAIELMERRESKSESPIELVVSQGFLKGAGMDGLIRPLTELGMTRWAPFTAERSIPVPDEKKTAKRLQRWRTIASESMKQCGRWRIPRISAPVDFKTVITQSDHRLLKIFFYENATTSFDSLPSNSAGTDQRGVHFVIGPEGGFSVNEAGFAIENGFHPVSLGPRILRSETAATAACTLIQHLFGDL